MATLSIIGREQARTREILNRTADELADDFGVHRSALDLFVNVALERISSTSPKGLEVTVEQAILNCYDREDLADDVEETDDEVVDRVIGWATEED